MLRLILFLICVVASLDASGATKKQPNLLLIVADDMGYGDLSCYGSKQIKTPNLDALAAHGVRCTDGYVSANVCSPSRAGLMTGRSGSRFGYEHNLYEPESILPGFAGVPLDEPLISDRLKALGYRTGIIGKWHLGSSVPAHHPNERGFDFFFGMLGGGHHYFPTVKNNSLLFNHEKPKEIRTPYLTDWFTLEAIDFIKGVGKAATDHPEKPWFLYLSYNTPHSPMQAKKEDIEAFSHIHNKTRRIYCAMQHCMDQNIGKVIATLKEQKQFENTLIVFISDNGGSVEVSHAVNAPLRGTKGTFLEGGIRVPTIYHWPRHLEGGRVYTQPIISTDIQATMIAAAGGTPPTPGVRTPRKGRSKKNAPIYDGVNLLPYLQGEINKAPHDALYWRSALRGKAIREGDWKLLCPNSERIQLYNLKDDVGEMHNVIDQHPKLANHLIQKMVDWEVTLERNPLFMSDPYWGGYNRSLYQKTYSLTQPEPDDTEDIWAFKAP